MASGQGPTGITVLITTLIQIDVQILIDKLMQVLVSDCLKGNYTRFSLAYQEESFTSESS